MNSLTDIFNNDITELVGDGIFSITVSDMSLSKLTKIDLPNCSFMHSITFSGCSNLSYVNLPNVFSFGSGIFSGCSNIQYLNISNAVRIWTTTFANGPVIDNLTLPYCTHLETTSSAVGYTHIKEYHFPKLIYAFGSLISHDMLEVFEANILQVVNSSFFNNCTTLKTISLPNVHTFLASLTNCVNLSEVYMPNLVHIEGGFYSCTALSDLSFPKLEYGLYINNNSALQSINLPNAFYIGGIQNCTALTNVSLPKLISIANPTSGNFFNCPSLSSVELPEIRYINANLFSNCTNLSIINFPKLYEYRGILYTCKTSQINFSNLRFFSGGISGSLLESIVFPKLIVLSGGGIRNCSALKYVEFPKLKYIYDANTFQACKNLQSVILSGSNKVILTSMSTFNETPMVNSAYLGYFGSVYVPSSLVDSYKTATNWASISDRITAYIE